MSRVITKQQSSPSHLLSSPAQAAAERTRTPQNRCRKAHSRSGRERVRANRFTADPESLNAPHSSVRKRGAHSPTRAGLASCPNFSRPIFTFCIEEAEKYICLQMILCRQSRMIECADANGR